MDNRVLILYEQKTSLISAVVKNNNIPTRPTHVRLRMPQNTSMHPTLDHRILNYYRFIL